MEGGIEKKQPNKWTQISVQEGCDADQILIKKKKTTVENHDKME